MQMFLELLRDGTITKVVVTLGLTGAVILAAFLHLPESPYTEVLRLGFTAALGYFFGNQATIAAQAAVEKALKALDK